MKELVSAGSRWAARHPATRMNQIDAMVQVALLILLMLLAVTACGGESPEPAGVLPPTASEEVGGGEQPAADTLYGAPAAEIVSLTPIEVAVPNLPVGWNGARIAVLSDLQLSRWADNPRVAAAALRRAVEAGRADVIAVIGVDLTPGADGGELRRLLQPLSGKPVIAVSKVPDLSVGSTDDQSSDGLGWGGVKVLRNEVATLVRAGDTLRIAGLGSAASLPGEEGRSELWARLSRRGPVPLLLTTSPRTAAALPPDAFDLVVAGGAFCGQLDVPGVPRLETIEAELPDLTPAPRVPRLYTLRGNSLFITCGLGYSFVPVRFGAPPQIVMVTLRRATEPLPASADADSVPAGVEGGSALES